MRIITGSTGETHVTSNNDGEFNQSIFGDGLVVLSNGQQLAANMIDYNTIQIKDGDLVFQGRHALIEPNTADEITIETGAVGYNRNDLIVAHYEIDVQTGYEELSLEVIKGAETKGTAVDPEHTEGDIRTGALVAEAPLYRVKIKDVKIEAIEPLFTVQENLLEEIAQNENAISELNSTLNTRKNITLLDNPHEVEYAYRKGDTCDFNFNPILTKSPWTTFARVPNVSIPNSIYTSGKDANMNDIPIYISMIGQLQTSRTLASGSHVYISQNII